METRKRSAGRQLAKKAKEISCYRCAGLLVWERLRGEFGFPAWQEVYFIKCMLCGRQNYEVLIEEKMRADDDKDYILRSQILMEELYS